MPHALASLLLRHRRLQLLAPHPDDEIFGGFGLICAAQQLGLEVEVHVVTDGERCFGALPVAEESALRAARRAESLAAARALGYAPPQFWQLGDSQLMDQRAALAQRLRAQCRADALVVAPWWHDGHPDHEAVGLALRAQAAAARRPSLYYAVWGLVDGRRQARWQQTPGRLTLALTPAQQQRKRAVAALFKSQLGLGAERAIVGAPSLAAFTTDQEHYLHAA